MHSCPSEALTTIQSTLLVDFGTPDQIADTLQHGIAALCHMQQTRSDAQHSPTYVDPIDVQLSWHSWIKNIFILTGNNACKGESAANWRVHS
jgi:hypothetical protein